MASFTLNDIHKAAEAKYGSTDFELEDGFTVKLLNPLRLSKTNRDALIALQETLNDEKPAVEGEEKPEPVDQQLVLQDSIRLVADSETGATKLLDSIGDDLAALVTIFGMYSDGTQAGEASGSQS